MQRSRTRIAAWWWVPWGVAVLLAAAGLPLRLLAQPDALYFPATGHHMSDESGFLSYWRARGGERLLGLPVTEEVAEHGVQVQYFERGRLEKHPELAGSPLLLGLVGSEYARATWRSFAPADTATGAAGARFFDLTGHSLTAPFLTFWQANGGIEQFGYPISEPLWEFTPEGQIQVQYFERARLEHHPLAAGSADEVRISDLGRALAALNGHELAPVANTGYEVYGAAQPTALNDAQFMAQAITPDALLEAQAPAAPEQAQPAVAEEAAAPAAVAVSEAVAAAPAVVAAVSEPVAAAPVAVNASGKHIVVSIGDQWLYAYEGDALVFDAPVSTGRDGFNTPTGSYSIYAKLPKQSMSGTIGGEYYNVPNVPNVMYINGGVALHGTYWHNMFGSGVRLSHGCVNLPLGAAAWLYTWAPVGTSVRVVS